MRSVAQRIRNVYRAAVAEVDDNDSWQIATFGVACVSNSAQHCEQILREIVGYVESSRLDAEVMDIETDVITF